MKTNYKLGVILVITTALLLLSACGPSPEAIAATQAKEAKNEAQTQTANAPTPTDTPLPTSTFTPTPLPTDTPTAVPTATYTPTPAPCSNVDLNGRYVDYRLYYNILYGYIMDAEQNGCEFTAVEYWYLKVSGPGNMSKIGNITGTIEEDGSRVRVCYVETGYCLNLVIFDRGGKLVNGVEFWQYEKLEE